MATPIDFATPSRWSCCWRVCPSTVFPFCSGTRACELRRGITPRGSVRDKSNWKRMCARRGARGRSRGHVQGTRENSGLYLTDSKLKNLVLEGGVEPPQAIENTQLIDFVENAKRQKRPTRPIWARTGHTEKRPVGQLGRRMVTRSTFIHPHTKNLSVHIRASVRSFLPSADTVTATCFVNPIPVRLTPQSRSASSHRNGGNDQAG